MRIFLWPLILVALAPTLAKAQTPIAIPAELDTRIQEITASCKEGEMAMSAAPASSRVTRIDLNGDGSRDFLFDTQQVCGASAGYGCSNRGCYLVVYKQVGPNAHRKILDELYSLERFISISKKGRLNLIAYSAPGGFGRCQHKSRDEGCDYLLFWKNGGWKWESIQ
jgi:hypothetical protein